MSIIDLSHMTRIDDLATSLDEDVAGMVELAEEAKAFVLGHSWCTGIRDGYLDRGWPGVLGVFHFVLLDSPDCPDPSVWVIVGDIPPAYIDVSVCFTGAQALAAYYYAMREWVERAIAGESADDVIPVYYRHSFKPISPSLEMARSLKSRLTFIESEILPMFDDDLWEWRARGP